MTSPCRSSSPPTSSPAASTTSGPAVPPSRTVVLDVRWTLAEPDGRPAFRAGHIPGAVYVDLDHELADHAATGQGRHPLPSEAAFTEAMRRWGLRDGDTVVVMDDLGNQSSARAWWLLRHAGFADVRMLDGALAGLGRGGASARDRRDDRRARRRDRALRRHADDRRRRGGRAPGATGVLLDARAAERYRGEVEPIDPRAGHVPGALSAPTAANLDADGPLPAARALRARFAALGIEPGTRDRGVLRLGRHRGPRDRGARDSRASTRRCSRARGASGRTSRAGRWPRARSRAASRADEPGLPSRRPSEAGDVRER